MSQGATIDVSASLASQAHTVEELLSLRRRIFSSKEEMAALNDFLNSGGVSEQNGQMTKAKCLWLKGDYDDAMEALNKAGEDESGVVKAMCLLARGQAGDAAALLKREMLKKACGCAYAFLARAQRAMGNLDAASETVARGLEIFPDNALLVTEKAVLADIRGDYDEAFESYEKALEIDPQCVEALFRLAYTADLYGDNEKALS